MFKNPNHFDLFTPFFSASSSQLFLKKCYSQLHITEAESKSYQNCYPFIYYLEHAKTYYEQANISPLSIKPILLFYGYVQLLKACLLTIDPNYPESTSLLAHGVTTRKRKKQQYDFLKDEVKVQKNGLLPCTAEKLFQLTQLEGEKFTMETLIREIPEMQSSSLFSKKNFETLIPFDRGFLLPKSILDDYKMTSSRFLNFIETKSRRSFTLQEVSDGLLLEPSELFVYNSPSPIRYHIDLQVFMLSLNKNSNGYLLPELFSHYLILYNLSMIARYETEWWSELLKTMPNDDYPTIIQFLKVTQFKTPFLVYDWLINGNSGTNLSI